MVLLVALLGGGLANAGVALYKERRAARRESIGDRTAADVARDNAEDARIERIYDGFEHLIQNGKVALEACEAQLRSCEERSAHLGETVSSLDDKVRSAMRTVVELQHALAEATRT